MTFFFDRSTGVTVPKALILLKLREQVEYHEKWFASDELDDKWLPSVGQCGWTVIGHDRKYHLFENELRALKQYKIGCFYLWGGEASKWEKMRVFAAAYDRIIKAAADTPRPFAYDVDRRGRLSSIPLP